MDIIKNPHDKFFKETLSKINVAQDFLLNYLPDEILQIIDIEELEIVKDSFIDKKMQERFSDLLYKVKINNRPGYIYTLFEHKSYPYHLISFQLLKYMISIWDLLIKQDKTEKPQELPLIIPLVFYQGKERWSPGQKFLDMLGEIPEELKIYFPDFKYILYDLSRYSSEELKGKALLRIFLELTNCIYDEDFKIRLIEILNLFRELSDQKTGMEYFETVIRYIINTREDLKMIELKDMVEQTLPERSGLIMTLADRLKEEGKKEGIKEGIKEGLIETVNVLLNKKLKANELSIDLKRINSLDIGTLKKIRDNIFDISSLDDLEKYIN